MKILRSIQSLILASIFSVCFIHTGLADDVLKELNAEIKSAEKSEGYLPRKKVKKKLRKRKTTQRKKRRRIKKVTLKKVSNKKTAKKEATKPAYQDIYQSQLESPSEPVAQPIKEQVRESLDPVHQETVEADHYGAQMAYSTPRSKKRKKWGLNIYTFYSGADHIKTTTNSLDSDDYFSKRENPSAFYTGEFSTSASYGLGIEHSSPRLFKMGNMGLGYSAGVSYEFPREIDRNYVMGSFSRTVDQDYVNPSLTMILPYANAYVTYKRSYMFIGGNFSVPQVTDASDEDFEGLFGYQAGFGYAVSSWISLEAVHRWIRFSSEPKFERDDRYDRSFSDDDSIDRSGLGLLEKETLQLNGFNLNLKVRF